MADFEVKIITSAELEGAKQLEQQLEREIGKAKALGKAYDEKQAQLAQVRSVINGASADAVKGVEKEILSHRELREAVGGVGRAFGGLADVGLWLSPQLAALALVLKAVELIKEAQDHVIERQEAIARVMSELDTGRMEALATAAERVAAAQEDVLRSERAIADAMHATETAMGNRIALYDAQIEAAKKADAEDEKLAEAKLDRQVKLGIIAQAEADQRKAAMQEHLQALNAVNDTASEQNKIAEKEKELREARARIPLTEHEIVASAATGGLEFGPD